MCHEICLEKQFMSSSLISLFEEWRYWNTDMFNDLAEDIQVEYVGWFSTVGFHIISQIISIVQN